MSLTIIKLVLFICSTFGYCELLTKKARIKPLFAPATVICSQVSILFLSGVLNCLKEASIALWFGGIVLFLCYLYKQKQTIFLKYIHDVCGWVYFFLVILICAIALKGVIFTHYDNFSHWAIVVRSMIINNRYPNFEDSLILFQYYPLGSATYIYYFSKTTSTAESVQMLAQVFMMTAFLLPVFAFVKKNRKLFLVFMVLFTNFIFVYNIKIQDLLVDTLLPIVGVAAIIVPFYDYVFNKESNEKTSVLWSILFSITLVQIKNSGIFFFIGVITLLVYLGFKKVITFQQTLVSILAPLISVYIWKKHCLYVFSDAATSKHAMSMDNYKNVFGAKGSQEIYFIIKQILYQAFQGRQILTVFLFLLIAGVITCIFVKDKKSLFWKVLLICVSMYVIYMVGMTLMYLFSMPGDEATSLAGYVRYRKTILISIYYVIVIYYAIIFSNVDKRNKIFVLSLICVLCMLSTWRVELGDFTSALEFNEGEERTWFQEVKNVNGIPEGSSYGVVIESPDFGYAHYLIKYIFFSNDIAIYNFESDFSAIDSLKDKEYILLYYRDDRVNDWVKENYPDQINSDYIKTTATME